MQPQLPHATAVGVQLAVPVEGTQLLQHVTGLLQGGGSGGIQPRQPLPQWRAPQGQLQCQRHRVGDQQLGRVKGRTPLLVAGSPQAQAAAGAQASGTPLALGCAGLAGRCGHQAIHARSRIKAVAAAQPAVDHQLDRLNRQ